MGVTYKAFDTSLYCQVGFEGHRGVTPGQQHGGGALSPGGSIGGAIASIATSPRFFTSGSATSYYYAMEFIDGKPSKNL